MGFRVPEEEVDPKESWKEAVANDDTEMSFHEWCEYQEGLAIDAEIERGIAKQESREANREIEAERRMWAGCDGPGGY